MKVQAFKHVNYLWDEKKAAELEGDEIGLFLYRSNILKPLIGIRAREE